MVCIAGFLTRYATIDATNIVGITINAVIKLAIMGGVYVIGLICSDSINILLRLFI